ncbi:MAG: anti-sigma F factor [Firmicutes bacterium]|nr:anti-sigma F factor [Bacillota bacterium]
MGSSINQLTMEFPSKAVNIGFARTAVAMFAAQLDFTLDELDEIKIAVSEAVSNSVIHGYKGTEGMITIICAVGEGALEVQIKDEGVGIDDIEKAFEPAFTTAPKERMGLGLVFVKEYMDELIIDSVSGRGTSLIMKKSPCHNKVEV